MHIDKTMYLVIIAGMSDLEEYENGMAEIEQDKTLSLYPIDYPFETLVTRIQATPAKLKLDPEFQRKYKWDKEGWGRSSRFIESCLMRIPLPSCYFAEDESGRHIVIDGVQRLTTITRFFNDEFALEGMTTFKELEGKKFSELGPLHFELESTTIRCIVLRKENPQKLIREIFSRLNQGAVALSHQEVRHAVYPGSLAKLLTELGNHPAIKEFGLAKNSQVKRDSLEPEEQILRFFAFSNDPELAVFDGRLKDFLDNYMERNSELSQESINTHKEKFEQAIKNCTDVFGDDAFTNTAVEKKRKGLIYYDLLMTTLGKIDHAVAIDKKVQIQKAYKTLCQRDDFEKAKSGGLQRKSSILKRRASWTALLEAAVNAN